MTLRLALILLPPGAWGGVQDAQEDAPPAPRLVARIGGDGKGTWGAVSCIAFSPDGSRVAGAGLHDGSARVWDSRTRDVLLSIAAHPKAAFAVAWFPDGAALASGGGEDSLIRIWDSQSGRLRMELNGEPGRYWSVAVAPDGKSLAAYRQDEGVRVWDLSDGRPRFKVDAIERGIAFSPDSRMLATNLTPRDVDRTPAIALWKVESGELLKRLTGHTGFGPLLFAADGKTLMAGLGKSITVWEVETGRLLQTRTLSGRCSSLACSPDGRWVAAGDRNGALHLWDASLEKELAVWPSNPGMVYSVAFAPHAPILAGGGGDSTIVFWDLTPLRR